MADALQAWLSARGLSVQRQGHNLWTRIGQGGPHLLMVSHLDTVPVCEGWTSDPFDSGWKQDRLVGLGANDAKGCVAAMASAAVKLARTELEGSVTFAFTAEEEVGGGAGLATVLPSFGSLDAAVVGEPTGLEVCVAQRGMLLLRCVAHGVAAHAAHGQLGENAIHKAARDIAKLEAMVFESHPLLGAAKAQVTEVKGGLTRNQVPDRCEFFVDLRTLPGLDHDEVAARIQAELDSEVTVHSGRYGAKATDPAHPLVQAALACAKRNAPVGSVTTSDWAFLGDLPAVKVGPGDSHRSHRPDEYLTRAELMAGEAFYRSLVPAFFAAQVAHA